MSIRLAFTFDMFNKLTDLELKSNGFYALGASNAQGLSPVNSTWKPVLTPLGVTTANVGTTGNFWMASGAYTLINPNSGYLYIGARAYNFKGAHANSSLLPFMIGSKPFHLFNGATVLANITTDEVFLELVVDRYQNIIFAYIDGTLVNQVAMTATESSNIASSSYGWGIAWAAKQYSSASVLSYMDDITVVESDDTLPNYRLGPVRLTARPVVVKAISGFDTTDIAVAKTKLGTVLDNGATSGAPTNKAPIKANTAASTIDFSIDVGNTPTDRQVAVTFFTAGIKNSTNAMSIQVERTLDGVAKLNTALDVSVKATDRYNWMAGGFTSKPDKATARSLNDATYRLKVTETT